MKKYVITESQLRLLESFGIISTIVTGCITGGLMGLVYILRKVEKEDKEEKLSELSNADKILLVVKGNNYKSFKLDICELKDKSVNFVKISNNTDLPVQIEKATFYCNVLADDNKFDTFIVLGVKDLRNNSEKTIKLTYDLFAKKVEWQEGVGRNAPELENYKLKKYITNTLSFPIGFFNYHSKTKIKTDF